MNIFAREAIENGLALKGTLSDSKIELVDVSVLKPHEDIDAGKLRALREDLLKNGINLPIVVDRKTKIILDGHHRYHVFKRMHIKKIPVFYVDYSDSRIVIDSWRGQKITKGDVIKKVASGGVFPRKTTKHMFLSEGGRTHISSVLPNAGIMLTELMLPKDAKRKIPDAHNSAPAKEGTV